MIMRAIIYQCATAGQSAVSGTYVIEAKDGDGNVVRRGGVSVTELAKNCLKEPVLDLRKARITSIPAEGVDMESGDKITRVSLHDLVRFRRAYLEI
jgi:hypothetical protein